MHSNACWKTILQLLGDVEPETTGAWRKRGDGPPTCALVKRFCIRCASSQNIFAVGFGSVELYPQKSCYEVPDVKTAPILGTAPPVKL